MVARLSVKDSRALLATILAVRQAPLEIQKQIRQQLKAITAPEWQKAMAEQASIVNAARVSSVVLVSTARVAVSNQNVRLSSATVGRKLKGGLNPKTDAHAFEFGANPTRRSYDATSRKGRRYTVRDRLTTAQLPRRSRSGWIFYPAAAGMIPRVASLMVQTVVRTIAEAWEGKR